MTTHQANVLDYFRERRTDFVDWLMQQNSTVIIDDLTPLTVGFLDISIKEEITKYANGCVRHQDLVDMLIEIHSGIKEAAFRKLLRSAANSFFTQPV